MVQYTLSIDPGVYLQLHVNSDCF